MKKETFIANLNFVRIQTRNLYIALLKNDIKFADDVLSDIDDSVLNLRGDTEQLYKALDDREEYINDQKRYIEKLEEMLRKAKMHMCTANGIYGLCSERLTDPENPDSPMWKDFAPDELTRTGLLEEDD